MDDGTCAAADCAERASVRGLCRPCYMRQWRLMPENIEKNRIRATLARQRERSGIGERCTVEGCDRVRRAKGMCNMHYKRVLRAEGREKNPTWDDRRRSNYHNRRVRMQGGRNGELVLLQDLVARCGVICAWCGEAIDLRVEWPDPLSKSIDHIVPISRGGSHELSNCQLMHLGCNSQKGDRLAA